MATKNELLGRKVKVISDNDSYDSFRNKTLIITHVAFNTKDHPGYDNGINSPGKIKMALCDFKATDGSEINNSLYEYKFRLIS